MTTGERLLVLAAAGLAALPFLLLLIGHFVQKPGPDDEDDELDRVDRPMDDQ